MVIRHGSCMEVLPNLAAMCALWIFDANVPKLAMSCSGEGRVPSWWATSLLQPAQNSA